MVLRMLMRWAERRGFKVELLEASAGEEAGIKSATFRADGRERLRPLLAPRRACTGSCACRRSTPPTAARRRSPASRSRRSSRRPARSRSTTTTCRSTPTARRAPAASTSTRPTRPCASRTGRPGIVVQCQNERSQSSNKRDRDGDAALQARRARGAQAPGGDRARARRGAGRQLRLADPLLRPAPVHDGQGPPHRLRGRRRRRACSTATSTASSAPTCCAGRARVAGSEATARRAGSRPGTRSTEQPTAPYLDAVVAYGFRGSTRFHVPGHKGGAGRRPRAALARSASDALTLDVPQDIEGIDLGPAPTPYERAEQLAAEALRRRALVVPHQRRDPGQPRARASRWRRSARRSSCSATRTRRVVDGLVLSGGVPDASSRRSTRTSSGMAHGVTPESLAAALARDAGRARRVHRLADLLRHGRRRRGLRRGLPRRRRRRSSSTRRGARTSASTPTCRRARSRWAPTRCSPRRTRSSARSRSRRCCTSRRPAASTPTRSRARCGSCARRRRRSLLMASLDAARRQLAVHGEALLDAHDRRRRRARARRSTRSPACRVIGEELVGRPGVAGWDPLRIVIDVRGTGCTRLRGRRRAARGLRHPRRARHARDDRARARPRRSRAEALERFAHDFDDDRRADRAPGRAPRRSCAPPARCATRSSSRRARRSSGAAEVVAVDDAVGRVSAESIAGYPPGIPALLPGERITAEVVAYLRELARRRRAPARRERPGVRARSACCRDVASHGRRPRRS